MKDYSFSRDFSKLVEQYPKAKNLIINLQKCGELLFFGGSVREYNQNKFKTIPRDFDIVIKKYYDNINIEDAFREIPYKRNRFGGYKIKVDSLEFDIWELENTWAFKEKKIDCSERDYSLRLKDTVFLNIDSIVYNLSTDELYDDEYEKAMKNRILDIVLLDNPFLELNILRAIIFKRQYDMTFSNQLLEVLEQYVRDNESTYLEKLYKIQIQHYSINKLDKETLKEQIDELLINRY